MSEEDGDPQSRKWIATLWLHMAHLCLEETMKSLTDTGRVRFIAYGEEVCPSTGTLHYQAYIVGYKPLRRSQLVRWLGEGHHFSIMRGTLKQNDEYCSKEGSFHKLGDEPKQGERHDLIGFKRGLDEGKSALDVSEEDLHFGTYVKFHKGLEKYEHYVRGKKIRLDRTQPKVYLRIGETNLGKTRWLDEQFGRLGWAFMPNPTSTWFITRTAAYSDTVVIDDVGPTKVPQVEAFLNWTDRYPIEFNSKGDHYWFHPKNIVITSNCHWTKWWSHIEPAHLAALRRRFYRIDYVYKNQPSRQEYPNGEDDSYLKDDGV